MDENTSLSMEQQSADQQDAFLEGWGDETPEAEEPADQQDSKPEDEADRSSEADSAETDAGTEGADAQPETETPETKGEAGEDGAGQSEEQKAPQTWNVKHMGQEKTLGVTDVTPELLQKGLDYDRIRGKYDEAKPVMEMFTQFAAKAGMSVSDYVKLIRQEAKRAGGMSQAEAQRAVELEDREAAVSAKEAEAKAQEAAKKDGEDRVKNDLAQFAQAFPEVYEQAKSDKKAIPDSVWKDVNAGMPLTAAYARYAVAKANEEAKAASQRAEAAAQNRKNALRSTGSMRSAGSDTRSSDPFLDGFGS